jgi:oxygen-independent coproporphyrinogen-3 oxidase
MALSVYVHIPYCLQRCRYCDFTTFEFTEILPPEKYVQQVRQEIRSRNHLWRDRDVETLYFGGGTPSLVDPQYILDIVDELANAGFKFKTSSELTIEINPATISEEKLRMYLKAGINRFSVGAQTFDDSLLKMCGRKHSAQDTRETLKLLQTYDLNYSFDLLFALPGQTLDGVNKDLQEVVEFSPPHLSAYCLTVPEGHPMSGGRAPEGEQVEMFAAIEGALKDIGLSKYEISNFAKPGYESRHNLAYWNDSNYWGIGLSSHSYARDVGAFGTRFWNPKSLHQYADQVGLKAESWRVLPETQREELLEHESLTDFCHMHLRTEFGLPIDALRNRFRESTVARVLPRLEELTRRQLLQTVSGGWNLTPQGQLISNKVFEKLTFSADELGPGGLTVLPAHSYLSV